MNDNVAVKVKETLIHILSLQGINTDAIEDDYLIVGESSPIDSLTTTLFIVELEDLFSMTNLLDDILESSLYNCTLRDVTTFIENKCKHHAINN